MKGYFFIQILHIDIRLNFFLCDARINPDYLLLKGGRNETYGFYNVYKMFVKVP